jgi:hypothetical protein
MDQKVLVHEIESAIKSFEKKTHSSFTIEMGDMIIEKAKRLNLKSDIVQNVKFFEILSDNERLFIGTEFTTLQQLSAQSNIEEEAAARSDSQQELATAGKPEPQVVWPAEDEDENWGIEERTPPLRPKIYSPKSQNSPDQRYRISKRLIFNSYMIDAEVLNFINFNEFYVRNLEPYLMSKDDNFLAELQKFYTENQKQPVKKPRVNFIAVYQQNEKWHRVRVTEINGKTCNLFLFDAGRYEHAQLSDLILMHPYYFKHHQIAIKCSMADVAPIDKEYPQTAVNEFKKCIKDSSCSIKLIFTKDLPEGSDKAGLCTVYIRFNGQEINFNTLLVEKGYARSTGKVSAQAMAVIDENQQRNAMMEEESRIEQIKKDDDDNEKINQEVTTRVSVKILKINDPGDFYIGIEFREMCKYKMILNKTIIK